MQGHGPRVMCLDLGMTALVPNLPFPFTQVTYMRPHSCWEAEKFMKVLVQFWNTVYYLMQKGYNLNLQSFSKAIL